MSSARKVPSFSDYLLQHKDKTPDESLFDVSLAQPFQSIMRNLCSEFREIDISPLPKNIDETGFRASPGRDRYKYQKQSTEDRIKSNKAQDMAASVTGRLQMKDFQDCYQTFLGKENDSKNAQLSQRVNKYHKNSNLNQKSLLHEASPELKHAHQDMRDQDFDFERFILADFNSSGESKHQLGFKAQQNYTKEFVIPFQALEETEKKDICKEKIVKDQEKINKVEDSQQHFDKSNTASCSKKLVGQLLQSTLNSPETALSVGCNTELSDKYSKRIERVLCQFMKSEEFHKQIRAEIENTQLDLKTSKLISQTVENTSNKDVFINESKNLKSKILSDQGQDNSLRLCRSERIGASSLSNSPAQKTKPLTRRTPQTSIDLQSEKGDNEQAPECSQQTSRNILKNLSLSNIQAESQSKPLYEIRLIISTKDIDQKETTNLLIDPKEAEKTDTQKPNALSQKISGTSHCITVELANLNDATKLNDKSISITVAPQLQDSHSLISKNSTTNLQQEDSISNFQQIDSIVKQNKEDPHEVKSKTSSIGEENDSLMINLNTKRDFSVQKTNSFDLQTNSEVLNNLTKEPDFQSKNRKRTNSISSLSVQKEDKKAPLSAMQAKQEQKRSDSKQGSNLNLMFSAANTIMQSANTTSSKKESESGKLKLKGYSRNKSLGCITNQHQELKLPVDSIEFVQPSSNKSSSQTTAHRETKKFINCLSGDRSTPSFAKTQNNLLSERCKKSPQNFITKHANGLLSQRDRLIARSNSLAPEEFKNIDYKIDLRTESQKQQYKAKLNDVISPSHTHRLLNETGLFEPYAVNNNNLGLQNLIKVEKVTIPIEKLLNRPPTKLATESKDHIRNTLQDKKKDWWRGVYSSLNNLNQK